MIDKANKNAPTFIHQLAIIGSHFIPGLDLEMLSPSDEAFYRFQY